MGIYMDTHTSYEVHMWISTWIVWRRSWRLWRLVWLSARMLSKLCTLFQVFAAYKTGLTNGVSLKVHVTPQTSAREVVNLVVKQLNLAAVLRGKTGQIYSEGKLENFCLVAVIGARERCLRDDFKPLQLQNPWRKGRLYVRLKNDVLAALDASTRKPSVTLPITRSGTFL